MRSDRATIPPVKRAWFALLAVAGCNSIFGNDQVSVRPVDALLGLDAPYGRLSLTYAVADGDPMAAPIATPFTDTVQVGRLDDLALHTDPRPVADGKFEIRAEDLQGTGYRLIYKAPDGIDVEFQSRLLEAHLVVPRIGRLDRTAPPANAMVPIVFSGGPNNQAGSWKQGRFFVTGRLWSEFDLGPCCPLPQTPPAKYPYPAFKSASGALGTPGSSETFVFTDSNIDDGGTSALSDYNSKVFAYATMKTAGFDASGAPISPVISPWITPPAAATSYLAWVSTMTTTYNSRTRALTDGADDVTYTAGGILASTTVMPFTENVVNLSNPGAANGDLDRIVMPVLTRSGLQPLRFANPYNGTDAPAYPTAVYLTGGSTRTFPGTSTTVRSGIQMVDQVQAYTNSQTHIAAKPFGEGVGLAKYIKIVPSTPKMGDETPIDLLSLVDQTPLPRSTAQPTLELTFTHDALDADALPSDCMVSVYRVEMAALTPLKRYLVIFPLASPIMIDQGLFDSTNSYTFGISCYHGHPDAATGDFRTIGFPFAASTIYTHSFKVKP